MYIENGQIKYTDDDMKTVVQRISELEAKIGEQESIICLLCEHIVNDRLRFCNEHHSVAHVYQKAKEEVIKR